MPNRNLVVGLFVAAGLTLFTIGLFLIGNRHQAFARHIEFYAEFRDLSGLAKGAKVQVAGMDAGQVVDIGIPDSPSSKFRLKLRIDEKFRGLVRTDSLATIGTEGVVGGTFLEIRSGSSTAQAAAAEENLAQYISHLRKALGDNPEDNRLIVTIARKGYQFTGDVVVAEAEDFQNKATVQNHGSAVSAPDTQHGFEFPVQQAALNGQKRWRKLAVLGASAAILVFASFMAWRHYRGITPPRPRRIMLAVLPFQNLTGDPNKDYLADGLTEETISQLGRLNPEQLGVIARTSVMGYKHKDERLDQIGRDLAVQYVLENSLRESGDHMRLTAQLIQVKDQTHLWSQDYDYPAKDILNVEDEVARAVARETRLRLNPEAESAQPHPVNPEAFDAYLQGHYFYERNTDKDTDTALKYFERATQLDPSYALAWVWLSRVRNWQANIGAIPADDGRRLAREEIERALALDPNLADAHIQMGRIREQADFDWAGADTSFQRAIALAPGNPEALRLAASSAAHLGRFDEALRLDHRAVDLDPLNADSWDGLAETEWFMGQLDQAAADSKKALEKNADVFPGPIQLSEIYLTQGRPHEALSEIKLVRYDPIRAFLDPIAYYALGREKESDSALSEFIAKYHAISAYQIAEVYAFRNQPDEAFKWLDRAYAQRDSSLMQTKVDPLLKSLHSDPQFTAVLRKLNLPN